MSWLIVSCDSFDTSPKARPMLVPVGHFHKVCYALFLLGFFDLWLDLVFGYLCPINLVIVHIGRELLREGVCQYYQHQFWRCCRPGLRHIARLLLLKTVSFGIPNRWRQHFGLRLLRGHSIGTFGEPPRLRYRLALGSIVRPVCIGCRAWSCRSAFF